MTETKIYVGLNDSESKEQKYDISTYTNVLKNVCKNYGIPFSFSMQQGGYMHENGEYTEENTLVISLIDAKNEIVNEMARDLCVFFHQESVLITEDQVKAYLIEEHL